MPSTLGLVASQVRTGAWLVPQVGNAGTPSSGPLPTDLVITARLRKRDLHASGRIIGVFDGSDWIFWMSDGRILFSYNIVGGGRGDEYPLENTDFWAAFDDDDEDFYLGLTFSMDDGQGHTRPTVITSNDGVNWTPVPGNPPPWAPPHSAITGIVHSGKPLDIVPLWDWDGRVYWVEVRSGLDPAGGTVLWRFDADTYPGSGTSYKDHQGRTWTLTNTTAIRVPRYLDPLVGTVSTPDPGVLPAQHTFVFKRRGLRTETGSSCVASQFEPGGSRSWRLDELGGQLSGFLTGSDGDFGGLVATHVSRGGPSDQDRLLAAAITLNDEGTRRMTMWEYSGSTFAQIGATTAASLPTFDSTGVVRVGAWDASQSEKYDGRIYSVQLHTGLDPAKPTAIPMVHGYLTPTVGTVTTPDPGPLPNECVFITKVRRTQTMATEHFAVQMSPSYTDRGFRFMTYNGYFYIQVSQNGTEIFTPEWCASMPEMAAVAPPGLDIYLATALQHSTGTASASQAYNSTDGVTWQAFGTNNPQDPVTPYDSTSPLVIGSDPNGAGIFDGRLYSVELRTGLDPAMTTARYLTPTVGTVTTPDPGPFPAQCTLIFTASQPTDSTGPRRLVSQDDGSTSRCWVIQRDNASDQWIGELFTNTTTNFYAPFTNVLTPPLGTTETFALTFDQHPPTIGTSAWRPASGGGWERIGNVQSSPLPSAVWDGTAPVRIGAHYGDYAPARWDGRIYSVELRTGLDPATTAARYLTPDGVAGKQLNSPNPGVLPDECTFVFKLLDEYRGVGSGGPLYTFFQWGSILLSVLHNADADQVGFIPPVSPTVYEWYPRPSDFSTPQELALSVSKSGLRRVWHRGPSGWAQFGPDVQQSAMTWGDTGQPIVFGGSERPHNIYYWELRTGLDPTGGTVVWRFDAEEAPTDATTTTWTDPRGRQWTVTDPQAISGRTLWKFDANEAPTDGTTTTWTDPRGRQWTVTNPQAISGRTLWRFDADEYPGTGTSYVDPRGRTWTLTAANAITPKQAEVPPSVLWRFDADDYPGTGMTYIDPRGRTWTLTNADAINAVS